MAFLNEDECFELWKSEMNKKCVEVDSDINTILERINAMLNFEIFFVNIINYYVSTGGVKISYQRECVTTKKKIQIFQNGSNPFLKSISDDSFVVLASDELEQFHVNFQYSSIIFIRYRRSHLTDYGSLDGFRNVESERTLSLLPIIFGVAIHSSKLFLMNI